MKTSIGIVLIICFVIIGNQQVEISDLKSDLRNYKDQDSTITYLTNKSISDSTLIQDLANLTTGEKHDEVLQVFSLNKRNVYYFKN